MPNFKVPVKDYLFLFNDVFDFQKNYQRLEGGGSSDTRYVGSYFTEASKFCENELAPLYQSGDIGCHGRMVKLPPPKALKRPTKPILSLGGLLFQAVLKWEDRVYHLLSVLH